MDPVQLLRYLDTECARGPNDHGQSKKYFHDIDGYNGRLDAIQAGILSVKLRRLETWNGQRRARAEAYRALLAGEVTAVLPHVPHWSRPVYHLYVVRVADRDRVQAHLAAAGIGTGIHYPVPLHLCQAYRDLGFRAGDFPVAEQAASEILSLPMFPGLSLDSQRRVAGELLAAGEGGTDAEPKPCAPGQLELHDQ
jgi:dTDP-4-amino-4,6-dideoxygalactose transaminase